MATLVHSGAPDQVTKSPALDNAQAAGDGEGLQAWRLLHEQYETQTTSRVVWKFWELLVREYETQTKQAARDFIKCGVVISGMQECMLKDHLVRHDPMTATNYAVKSLSVQIQTTTGRTRTNAASSLQTPKDKGKSEGKGRREKQGYGQRKK
eukprot:5193130-Amphidinium_carterae.1